MAELSFEAAAGLLIAHPPVLECLVSKTIGLDHPLSGRASGARNYADKMLVRYRAIVWSQDWKTFGEHEDADVSVAIRKACELAKIEAPEGLPE